MSRGGGRRTGRREGLATAQPWWRLHAVTVVAVVVSLVVTGLLAWLAATFYDSSAERVLTLRARDAGATFTAALPDLEQPLTSAVAVAQVTAGDVPAFESFVRPYAGNVFASVSLWRLGTAGPELLADVGRPLELGTHPSRLAAFFSRAERHPMTLTVSDLLEDPSPRIGYGYATPPTSSAPGYAAYAEIAVPRNRHTSLSGQSPFADLNGALYLGNDTRPEDLLFTTTHLPLPGRKVRSEIPLGDTYLTLVVAPKGGAVDGAAFKNLRWFIVGIGLALTAAVGVTAEYLARRRQGAELLAIRLDAVAAENEHLYREQRGIADTLQRALLPRRMPSLEGVELSARYLAGTDGIEVGGDWYDVVPFGPGRFAFAIGDVSGHGVRAAGIMASVRFALRAYVLDGHRPAAVLDRLSPLLDAGEDEHFATVLVGLVEVAAHRVELANAGHLRPIVFDEARSSVLDVAPGPPIGVEATAPYRAVTVEVPPRATLLAFTDGLVERRGADVDEGYRRVMEVGRGGLAPGVLLDRLVRRDDALGRHDDTALLAITWTA